MSTSIDGVIVEPLAVSSSGSSAIAAQDAKNHARVATTANGTLATAFADGQVQDGVTLATNDRILLKNQTAGVENGLHFVNATGAPTRVEGWGIGATAAGFRVIITEGTANADIGFMVTNNDGSDVVGTDALTFQQYTVAGAAMVHALGGASHTADTLANLNGKVSDATLIDTADSRLSDDRVSPVFSNYTSGHVTATVAAGGGTLSLNLTTAEITGLGVNGIVISKIQITPSIDCDDWTAELFRADTFSGEVDFSLTNVTTSASAATAEEVKKEMTIVDADGSSELHLKLTNDDPATTPTFLIEIEFTQRT